MPDTIKDLRIILRVSRNDIYYTVASFYFHIPKYIPNCQSNLWHTRRVGSSSKNHDCSFPHARQRAAHVWNLASGAHIPQPCEDRPRSWNPERSYLSGRTMKTSSGETRGRKRNNPAAERDVRHSSGDGNFGCACAHFQFVSSRGNPPRRANKIIWIIASYCHAVTWMCRRESYKPECR